MILAGSRLRSCWAVLLLLTHWLLNKSALLKWWHFRQIEYGKPNGHREKWPNLWGKDLRKLELSRDVPSFHPWRCRPLLSRFWKKGISQVLNYILMKSVKSLYLSSVCYNRNFLSELDRNPEPVAVPTSILSRTGLIWRNPPADGIL